MKQCPQCKTTYTDETLSYCLADGTPLTPLVSDEQQTVVRPGAGGQMRVEIPQETQRMNVTPTDLRSAAPAGSSGGLMKILLAVVALGVLVVAAIGVGAFIYFRSGGPDVAANNKPTNSPTTPPASDNTNELRDQIANLAKQLNDQKNANRPANIPLTLPNQPTTTTSARVNSPGDGFLALRTYPSSEIGARILQIPHGATVTVGGCLSPTRAGGKGGRWCRASYNGYSGWVYDAYLIY